MIIRVNLLHSVHERKDDGLSAGARLGSSIQSMNARTMGLLQSDSVQGIHSVHERKDDGSEASGEADIQSMNARTMGSMPKKATATSNSVHERKDDGDDGRVRAEQPKEDAFSP